MEPPGSVVWGTEHRMMVVTDDESMQQPRLKGMLPSRCVPVEGQGSGRVRVDVYVHFPHLFHNGSFIGK